jgi:hypothetical protein
MENKKDRKYTAKDNPVKTLNKRQFNNILAFL